MKSNDCLTKIVALAVVLSFALTSSIAYSDIPVISSPPQQADMLSHAKAKAAMTSYAVRSELRDLLNIRGIDAPDFLDIRLGTHEPIVSADDRSANRSELRVASFPEKPNAKFMRLKALALGFALCGAGCAVQQKTEEKPAPEQQTATLPTPIPFESLSPNEQVERLMEDLKNAMEHKDSKAIQADLDLLAALGPAAKPAIPLILQIVIPGDYLMDLNGTVQSIGERYYGRNPLLISSYGISQVLESIGMPEVSQVSDLIAILEKPISSESMTKAIQAIGHFGPEGRSAVPVLARIAAQYSNAWWNSHSIHAAEALGQMGSAAGEAAPAIIQMLAGYQSHIKAANRALAAIGIPGNAVIPPLVDLLDHQNQDVRNKARQVLIAMGPRAVPTLIELRVRELAEEKMEFKEVMDVIISARDPAKIKNLLVYMIKTHQPETIPDPLMDALNHQSAKVRLEMLELLVQYESGILTAAPQVIALLNDSHETVRRSAAEKLAQVGRLPDELDDRIIFYTLREDWESLARSGDQAVPVLIDALNRYDGEVVPIDLLKAIAVAGPVAREAAPQLIELLERFSGKHEVILEALTSFGPDSARVALPVVRRLFNEAGSDVDSETSRFALAAFIRQVDSENPEIQAEIKKIEEARATVVRAPTAFEVEWGWTGLVANEPSFQTNWEAYRDAAQLLYELNDGIGVELARKHLVRPRIRTLNSNHPPAVVGSAPYEQIIELGRISALPLAQRIGGGDIGKWSVRLLGSVGSPDDVFRFVIPVASGERDLASWHKAEARSGVREFFNRDFSDAELDEIRALILKEVLLFEQGVDRQRNQIQNREQAEEQLEKAIRLPREYGSETIKKMSADYVQLLDDVERSPRTLEIITETVRGRELILEIQDRVVPALIDYLTVVPYPISAIKVLARTKDERAIPVLIRLLEEEFDNGQTFFVMEKTATEALGTFGPAAKDAVPVLRQWLELDSLSPDDRSAINKALIQIGPASRSELRFQNAAALSFESLMPRPNAARDAFSRISAIRNVFQIAETAQASGKIGIALSWKVVADYGSPDFLTPVLKQIAETVDHPIAVFAADTVAAGMIDAMNAELPEEKQILKAKTPREMVEKLQAKGVGYIRVIASESEKGTAAEKILRAIGHVRFVKSGDLQNLFSVFGITQTVITAYRSELRIAYAA
ncbi:MAG: hypothetical protein COV74_06005 [Candidatus Omnitrophica bacterium CG11_big_fil_rev_8_21_14_0_20_45_26]|uniref:HEAT repeat domain-containing protein n=1 Tax=Candidatus Abzuiibacterium crystallinum TaxID=1974748 RepID=A0A2H0LP29_9BACT|nr:MAG: hypothetical protein COV74_06005 [Candidatus Omnitrophica bacterium CG11_big_fil_rev_8_21_14_0_20_45_26]PIW65304.1 MAG: hypothetical protein COW12_02510 [Candidatus Omnitrophica bacterium CG12_big_fil_rev_8_21_14_0_65_45_16]